MSTASEIWHLGNYDVEHMAQFLLIKKYYYSLIMLINNTISIQYYSVFALSFYDIYRNRHGFQISIY